MARRQIQIPAPAPAPIQVQLPPRDIPVLALNVDDAAEAISISASLLKEQIAAGRVHIVKFGARTVIPVEELRRVLRDGLLT